MLAASALQGINGSVIAGNRANWKNQELE